MIPDSDDLSGSSRPVDKPVSADGRSTRNPALRQSGVDRNQNGTTLYNAIFFFLKMGKLPKYEPGGTVCHAEKKEL